MSRSKAIALGIFTVWPLVYMVLFMCVVFGMIVTTAAAGPDAEPTGLFGSPEVIMPALFILHGLTMVCMLILIVIYLVHLFKTSDVRQDKKALWAVVLLLANIWAMPVYWYFYIWRSATES